MGRNRRNVERELSAETWERLAANAHTGASAWQSAVKNAFEIVARRSAQEKLAGPVTVKGHLTLTPVSQEASELRAWECVEFEMCWEDETLQQSICERYIDCYRIN
jgi:hypothetical protein